MLKSSRFDVFRILLIVGVVGFILFKIPHLYLPFYWDEAWVYAPAIKIMSQQGLSMLPGAIPVEYSRGHPLFFHFLGSGWIKLFGDNNFSVHCFALLISTLLILATY